MMGPAFSQVLQRFLQSPLVLLGGLIVLVIIGAIIIMVVGVLILFLPAIILAGVVWWLTRSEFLAGVAFLLVALIALVRR